MRHGVRNRSRPGIITRNSMGVSKKQKAQRRANKAQVEAVHEEPIVAADVDVFSESDDEPVPDVDTDKLVTDTTPAPQKGAVIYIGHIPRGFFEEEINDFFSQFGAVVNVRLSRNPKTQKSRHYAFLEFEAAEVASIVAKAMNGYMMFGRSLVCEVVRDDKLHGDMFKGSWYQGRYYSNAYRQPAAPVISRTKESHARRVQNLIDKSNRKRQKLQQAGISFDFVGFQIPVQNEG
uniref:RRM domain-containing protein n=1 Tax=Spongospora subterranea TaxID=70186 RepID=A0A0H5R8M6_9EUKA|eukprot:CRZ10470.1 hypothetical protein [Spongospora subterranea]